VRVVRFQDRTVEYASIDDMVKAANFLAPMVPGGVSGSVSGSGGCGGAAVSGGGHRQIRFYTNKGL
jgi:hypothetical protein